MLPYWFPLVEGTPTALAPHQPHPPPLPPFHPSSSSLYSASRTIMAFVCLSGQGTISWSRAIWSWRVLICLAPLSISRAFEPLLAFGPLNPLPASVAFRRPPVSLASSPFASPLPLKGAQFSAVALARMDRIGPGLLQTAGSGVQGPTGHHHHQIIPVQGRGRGSLVLHDLGQPVGQSQLELWCLQGTGCSLSWGPSPPAGPACPIPAPSQPQRAQGSRSP